MRSWSFDATISWRVRLSYLLHEKQRLRDVLTPRRPGAVPTLTAVIPLPPHTPTTKCMSGFWAGWDDQGAAIHVLARVA